MKAYIQRCLRVPLRPLVLFFAYFYYNTHFIDGDGSRVKIGCRCGLANTLFNVASGFITVGNQTAFGYNVQLLTDRHLFYDGTRASLQGDAIHSGWGGVEDEVPSTGFDIEIGGGFCWCASSDRWGYA